jgi:CHAT domain-containing protein
MECSALNNIGRNYFMLQEYVRACAYYDTAISIMNEIGDISGEATTLDNIGQVYEKLFDIDQAVSYYERSVALKESLRDKFHSPSLKSAYIEAEKDVYERLIILLIMLERYEEAFDYLERSRSEKLRRAFEQGRMSAYDPSLKRILERISFLECTMEDLHAQYRQNEIRTATFEEKMGEIQGKLNQKMLDLKIHHPDLYNVMVPQRKTLKYIQKTMPDQTIFIEFVMVENTYVMMVFARDIFLVKSLAWPADSINECISQMLTALQRHAAVDEVNEYCCALYQTIIEPLENHIATIPNIVIIPYGMLHYLPFHMLRRQNEEGNREYLMEWKRLSYLPSASFLIDLLEKQQQAEKELLAFGNADGTLPSAEIEVDLIARLFDGCCVCKCDSARKDRFIETCSDYRLIHLATHGILAPDPRFSYIVMAPPETGKLTVREILGLSGHFNGTSLVTLSACETAVEEDPETAGMELVTLSNAFKVAGVPSTVASLWEIADRSTALLMQNFYSNLTSIAADKAEALRQAQISMLDHEQYSHPYYWAPFVLIGDWR